PHSKRAKPEPHPRFCPNLFLPRRLLAMSAQWVRCPRCQVALQIAPETNGPTKCRACGADLPVSPSPLSATASWFVIQDKKKFGPLPLPQLQPRAREGRLKPGDMVLREGEPKWSPASSVAGLFVDATVSPSQGVAVALREQTVSPSQGVGVPVPAPP